MDDKLTLEMLRNDLTAVHERIEQYMSGVKPPVVQEVTLALRHVEDARMRLGVASTHEKGLNPWTNQVTKKD